MKNKITFTDKESSLKINSEYVLSTPEINEIKDVINHLSDEIDTKIKLSKFFKYISIYVPENIEENSDLIITFGSDENFTNQIDVNLASQPLRFLYFDDSDSTYKMFNKSLLGVEDAKKLLIFKLEDLIPSNFKYIKYHFNSNDKVLSYYNIDKDITKIEKIGSKYFPAKFKAAIFRVHINGNDLYEGESITFSASIDDKPVTSFQNISEIYDESILSIEENTITANKILEDRIITIEFLYEDEDGLIHRDRDSILLKKSLFNIEISDPLDLRVGEYTTFVAKLIGRTERDVTSLTTVDDFDYVSIENNKITAIRNSMLCNVADELTFKYNNGFHEYTVTDSVNILSSKFEVDILADNLYEYETTTFIAKLDDEDITQYVIPLYTSNLIEIYQNTIRAKEINEDITLTINFSYDRNDETCIVDDTINLKKSNLIIRITKNRLEENESTTFKAFLSGKTEVDVTQSIIAYDTDYVSVNVDEEKITATFSDESEILTDELTFKYTNINHEYITSSSIIILPSIFTVEFSKIQFHERETGTFIAKLNNIEVTPTISYNSSLLSITDKKITANDINKNLEKTNIEFNYTNEFGKSFNLKQEIEIIQNIFEVSINKNILHEYELTNFTATFNGIANVVPSILYNNNLLSINNENKTIKALDIEDNINTSITFSYEDGFGKTHTITKLLSLIKSTFNVVVNKDLLYDQESTNYEATLNGSDVIPIITYDTGLLFINETTRTIRALDIENNAETNVKFSYNDKYGKNHVVTKRLSLIKSLFIANIIEDTLYEGETATFVTTLNNNIVTPSNITFNDSLISINRTTNTILPKPINNDNTATVNFSFKDGNGKTYEASDSIGLKKSSLIINFGQSSLNLNKNTTFNAILRGRTDINVTASTSVSGVDYVTVEGNKITAIKNSILGDVADDLTFTYNNEYNNGIHEYKTNNSIKILSSTFTGEILSDENNYLYEGETISFKGYLNTNGINENVTDNTTASCTSNLVSINNTNKTIRANALNNDTPVNIILSYKKNNETASITKQLQLKKFDFIINFDKDLLYEGESTTFNAKLRGRLNQNIDITATTIGEATTNSDLISINNQNKSITAQAILNNSASQIEFSYTNNEIEKTYKTIKSVSLRATDFIVNVTNTKLKLNEITDFNTILRGRTRINVTSATNVTSKNNYVSIEIFSGEDSGRITAIQNSVSGNLIDEVTFKYNNQGHEYTSTSSIIISAAVFSVQLNKAEIYEGESTTYTALLDGKDVSSDANLLISSNKSSLIIIDKANKKITAKEVSKNETLTITFTYTKNGTKSISKSLTINNFNFDITLAKESVDFSEIDHNWYFDWSQCSGIIRDKDGKTVFDIGGDYCPTSNSSLGRNASNFVGWDESDGSTVSSNDGGANNIQYVFTDRETGGTGWHMRAVFHVDKYGCISGYITEYPTDWAFTYIWQHQTAFDPNTVNYLNYDVVCLEKYNSISLTKEYDSLYLDFNESKSNYETFPNKYYTNPVYLDVKLKTTYNPANDPTVISGINYSLTGSLDTNQPYDIIPAAASNYVTVDTVNKKISISDRITFDQVTIKFNSPGRTRYVERNIQIIRHPEPTKGFTLYFDKRADGNAHTDLSGHYVLLDGIKPAEIIPDSIIDFDGPYQDFIYSNGRGCYYFQFEGTGSVALGTKKQIYSHGGAGWSTIEGAVQEGVYEIQNGRNYSGYWTPYPENPYNFPLVISHDGHQY